MAQDLASYFDAHAARARDELFDFLRIPSVSARSEHDADTRRAAGWLRDAIAAAGLTAEVIDTPGHPIVLAEWRGAGPDRPTVLIYGHYDVQPAEPLELWESPAFEPTVRDGRIYARGSVDDKGQLFLHVKALEAHLAVRGTLPVNVIVLAEGEEEVGSVNLAPFIAAHRERLACDAVVISDSAMFAPGIPSILSSLRGLAYFEIVVQGPAGDLHSGSYGGAVVNPAMALARILATMHDPDGTIAIPASTTRCAPSRTRCGPRCARSPSTRSTSAPRRARRRWVGSRATQCSSASGRARRARSTGCSPATRARGRRRCCRRARWRR
jgi:acetylornithine deacetylase/succinyl-diaminopimelate desuccinylase-like protein